MSTKSPETTLPAFDEQWWKDYAESGRHTYHELLHPNGIAYRIAKDAWEESASRRASVGADAAAPLQNLGLEIREINAANGWSVTTSEEFADKYKFPAVLMLIVSEVAEALEAFRESDLEHFKEEMADVLIRVLDCVVAVDSDFDSTVRTKLQVNRGRGFHHGGKKRI